MVLWPRYKPITCWPIVNSTAVTAAPVVTSRHRRRTSGRKRNNNANNPVVTTTETSVLTMFHSSGVGGGQVEEPRVERGQRRGHESETSSRKPIATTRPNERTRSITNA